MPLPVTLFCLSVLVPWTPQIAGVELSPYRIVLLVTIIPCLSMWIAGKAGRIRIADIALMGYAAWCFLSLLIVHGPEFAIKSGGVLFIETIGAYLLARCYIRDAQDFYTTILWLFRGVA
ncbi:hypothetical protein, partial [Corallococcus exiguus]|uniref:hypothetical protein n=1 Tax=Corallococcus exiguus TaxID=83462 RepID=UPI001B8D06C9